MAMTCSLLQPQLSLSRKWVMAGSCAVFLATCLLFSPFVADDAYIVGRYALNAADGNGLVYNVGEQVSALTSPLHALLETLLAVFGLDPVAAYRVLAPFIVLAGWGAAVRQSRPDGPALAVFSVFSLASPFLALWTVGGLETPLLACLAVLFVGRLVALCQRAVPRVTDFIWLGVLGGLMFVARYDSVLVTVPPLLAVVAICWRRPGMWLGAAVCVAIAASWLGFAAFYYGDIFPTSYYLKLAHGGRAAIDSLSATLNFLVLSGLVLVVFAVRFPSLAGRPPLERAVLRGGAISAVLLLLYATQAAGQHMMYGYRLFMPYLMAAGLVLAMAVPAGNRWLAPGLLGWQALMIAVVALSGINPAPLTHLPGLNRAYAEYEFITPQTHGELTQAFREDAAEIVSHWDATRKTGQPRIYLRSGGIGYWLREFYVYEALVSFRLGCGVPKQRAIMASHYLQHLGFSKTGTLVLDTARSRADIANDAPVMSPTEIDWMGPTVNGYLYGPDPVPLELSTWIGGGCGNGD